MGRLGEAWNINQWSNPQDAVYQITVFINIGYLGPGLNDNVSRFKTNYPDWSYRYNMESIMTEIYKGLQKRFSASH